MVAGGSRLVGTVELETLLDELKRSARGGGEGLFGANSLSWKINRESALFLAAGRAALLQLAHPWVAAAITEHSRTLRDPIGRFHQTCRVMFTMSFGSTEQALEVARHLHRRHSGISGKLPEKAGPFAEGSAYEANDVAALRWVYATLVDSAVLAYELVLPALSITEREQYYAESRATAALFGIPREELPRNWKDFRVYIESMFESDALVVSAAAREMAHELQSGAGTWVRLPFWYRAFTAYLLPPQLRNGFQLSYGAREQRSTERALRWLPRIYRALPRAARFVGPYLEAQAKGHGESPPGMAVRLSNRLWTGESTLFVSGQ
jgi:uncharacterized protein (DUF2236 family)